MRGALVTKGGGAIPNLPVILREGITHLAWEWDEENLPEKVAWAYSSTDPSHPRFVPVVQRGPRSTMEILAADLSMDITRLGGGLPGQPIQIPVAVMPDIETTHNPDDLMAFYRAFRKLRAARYIYLTLEWHQAGWFSPELVNAINSDPRLFILPQAYETGLMHPVDPRVVVADLGAVGVREDKIQVFLRNDRMDIGWTGWIFDVNGAA